MPDILQVIVKSKKKLFVGLAGPGTGKSYTFETIIKSDEFKNKKILILSFINRLVDDLSEHFQDYENVQVSTLHSFARQKFVELTNDVDLDKDLDEVISGDYLFILGKSIQYDKKFHENALSQAELDFYNIRRKFYKHNKDLHSFNSIVYFINLLFTNDQSKIPRYDLILVDEFQDFNKLEWELIALLNKNTKVVLVGDDDQSLYGSLRTAKPDLIRDLFDHKDTQEFTLDYCYRCPSVIVATVNSLIANAKAKGYLEKNKIKEFKYPTKRKDDKNEISKKYRQIDFLPAISGDKLIYRLEQRIINDIGDKKEETILIIVPHYLKQNIYDGLTGKGINVVECSLFSNEKSGKTKHADVIDAFTVLAKRKTDNLVLRKILPLYLSNKEVNDLIVFSSKNKKNIWYCLNDELKQEIESDILIFKKVRSGKEVLTENEVIRLSKIFNLKNLLSKMIKGFNPVKRGATEVEIETAMTSKGLSADFVYYVAIDDKNMSEKGTITDEKICEFLVGITRATKKLTLMSLEDKNPKILQLINSNYINIIAQ